MRPYQRICLFLAFLVALDSFPVMAQSGSVPTPRRARVYEYSPPENAHESYVAVLGEVMNPGTYHVDSSELNLRSVIIQRAGGFTRDASRNIRVIRDGRVNHQERFSETNDTQLKSGDVLIVDSDLHGSRTTTMREFNAATPTVPAIYHPHPVTTDGVQLALINVLDYPVVVTIPPDRAALADIIDRLGQPQEVCSSTSILTAQGTVRGGQAIQLVSGSAVVFNRGAVNRNRLPPNLPKPIESQIAVGALSNLVGRSQEQTDELLHLGQQPIISSNNFDQSGSKVILPTPSEISAPLPPEIPPAFNEQRNESTDLSVNQKPKIATLPFTGNAPFTKSSLGRPTVDLVPDAPIPQPERKTVSMSELPTEAPLPPSDEAEDLQQSSSSIAWAIATLLLGGLMTALGLIFRQQLIPKRRQPYRASVPQHVPPVAAREPDEPIQKPAPLVKKTLLELLIKNEMPTTIEVLKFPSELALQGRIVTKPILHVDGPQNLLKDNGPHFAAQEGEGGYPLQGIVAELDKPDSEPVKRPHFIDRAPQSAKPVEAAAQAKPASGERSTAPLAKALFDLEQGGRS